MGQSLKKQTVGGNGKTDKEVVEVAEKYYEVAQLAKTNGTSATNFSEFYRTICKAVEEINENVGNTQIKVPDTEALREVFNKYHREAGQPLKLTKEEFEKILHEVVKKSAGFTGIGAKDILLYLFGIPITALFIKQRIIPRAIPDDIFIPGVTSATVLLLAALNKI